MEGLILLAAYAVILCMFEGAAVAVGFLTDSLLPAWSMVIFMFDTGLALWFAWPVALWLTGNHVDPV